MLDGKEILELVLSPSLFGTLHAIVLYHSHQRSLLTLDSLPIEQIALPCVRGGRLSPHLKRQSTRQFAKNV